MNKLFSLSVSTQRSEITAGFKHMALRALCLILLLVCLTAPAQAKTSQSLAASVKDGLVTISGSVGGASGQTVNLMVLDPGGNIDYLNTCYSGAGGRFKVSYAITNTLEGRYTVKAATKATDSTAETSFLYGPGRLEAAAVLEEGLVKVSGTAGEGEGRIISIRITAPDGELEYAGAVLSGTGGSFALSYVLENEQAGKYTVYIGSAGLGSPVVCYLLAGVETEVKANLDKDKLVTIEGSTSVSEKPVSVLVTGPEGEAEFLSGVLTEKDGTFRLSYIMENEIKGKYKVTASVRGLDAPVFSYFIYGTGLESLEISTLTLLPAFDNERYSYTAYADYMTSQVQVRPVSLNPDAVITVNGVEVKNSSESGSIDLNEGNTAINIAVTEPDGTVTTYVVSVIRSRAISADNNLSSLSLKGASLNEAFNSSVLSYTATVPNSTAYLTVSPLVSNLSSLVEVNGKALAYGAESEAIALSPGNNTVTVKVTAEAGNSKIYTITVKREYNLNLSELQLFSGDTPIGITPAFSAEQLSYTAYVPNLVTSVTVSTVKQDDTASVTVSGGTYLIVGENIITVKVTANDGSLSKDYTVKVYRAPSDNANLSALTLSTGSLKESFSPELLSYTADVANSVTSLKVSPVKQDETATVTVSGGTSLIVGENIITVKVIAQDGSTIKTYIIKVSRAPSSNANLSALTLSSGSLKESFSPELLSYTADVPNSVTSLTVSPVKQDETATVTVSGGTSLFVGENIITIKVTAQDGKTIKTYTVKVTRAPSDNSLLRDLVLSPGGLGSVFYGNISSYTVNVANSVSEITISPTVWDDTATVTVNGTAVGSGSASGPISLGAGINYVYVEVCAENGSKRLYTLTVMRAYSGNADLGGITVNTGTLSPAFNKDVTSYTVNIGNEVTSITAGLVTDDNSAVLTINGEGGYGNSATYTMYNLEIGSNKITVKVEAQNNASKTYEIYIIRAKSANANLSGLTVRNGSEPIALSPGFAPETVTYSLPAVSSSVSSLKLKPTADSQYASLTLSCNGEALTPDVSGEYTASLSHGDNTITIIVTAQAGNTRTYTVTVKREYNLNLSSLILSKVPGGGSIYISSSGTDSYTAEVDYTVTAVTVQPTAYLGTASISVNGKELSSGEVSQQISLNVGENIISITLTAQEDGSSRTYTVKLTRVEEVNVKLSNLTLSDGVLSFNQSVYNYNVTVNPHTESLTVNPVLADSRSTVTVNGNAPTVPVSLEFGGGNYILITVTGWDGKSTQNYSIRVNRPQSTDNTLSDLTVNDVSIEDFDPAVNEYSQSLDYAVPSVTIKPTANDTYSKVWVDNTEITEPNLSVSVSLTAGSSKTITIKVRPQAGTDATYTLTLTRAGSSKLSGLELSAGGVSLNLNADFNTDVLTYSVPESLANAVDTIKVKPMADPSASVTVTCNGGAAITPNEGGEYTVSLSTGSNEINIALTALNTPARTYKVTVNRLKSANANLRELVVGDRSISLSKDVTSYSVNVDNLPAAITLKPAAEDSTATVKVDGQMVVSGAESGPISLNVGNNSITVEVTAQDGSVRVYTITIIRAASDNAYLSGLTAEHNGTSLGLNYPFTKEYYTYSLSNVDNSVDSITVKPVRDGANSVLTVSCNGGDPISVGSDGKYTIGLAVGSNIITIKVTAQNGSVIKTYTLSVTRLQSSNANLSGLSVLEGAVNLTLSPTFSSGTATYSVTETVPNSTGSIRVVPLRADPNSTVSVSSSEGTVNESGGIYTVNLAVGSNTITVVVTAQNGIDNKTYTVNVTRAGSSNAYLSELFVGNQEINLTDETAYSIAPVANAVSSISVIAVLADNNAVITSLSCNGNAAAYNSDTDEYTAELIPGSNIISIVVKAQDGTVKTYTLSVKRKYDLSLSSLVLRNSDNNAAIAMTASGDSYDAGTLNYSIAGVTVTPTAAEGAAIITVGGKAVINSAASETIALSVGLNTIEVKVEAGGDLRTYTITVNRAAASNNADLKALTVDYGLWQLSPSNSETEYSLTVGSATSSVYIEYEAEEEHAVVSVNGGEMGTYVGWAAVNLSEVTEDVIPIVITAQDGTVKTYQLTVVRVPEYSNAQLSGLTLELYNCYDGGNYVINHDTQLIPTEYPQLCGFYKEYYDYDVLWVGDYVKVRPEAGVEGQSVEVSWFDAAGLEHTAEEYISTKTLKTIKIKVTAKDGVSVKEYTLDFNASYLKELQVYTAAESEPGIYEKVSLLPLSQTFSPSVMEYMVNISDTGSAEAIIIGAAADNEEAKVFVGYILLYDLYPYSVPFIIAEIDEDTPIVVTVEFGSDSYKITKTYTLTFYRDP